ncbi:BLUF domain-containing protein [Winogradskyella ouciana]|uniref:BLUF domain-containing protein n=1 Tax=Winogradskyella ouciana TaxID=2608631 RepID=A0A7K1GC11_9FLAO|nr:BLUF domain-containing protein [Winogradskyella ouciana]MTE25944.1 hypothetical protein [Winogradskyella ouciana]
MYQLNYRSKSKNDLKLEDLEDILVTANRINLSKRITGCLIYHNGSFVQILEGGKKDVKAVYEKIKLDDRHSMVTLLWESKVTNRCFPDWNMAYHKPNNNDLEIYINNLMLLSAMSEKSTASLLSFWESVHKILDNNHLSTEITI